MEYQQTTNVWKISSMQLRIASSRENSEVLVCKDHFNSVDGYHFVVGVALNGILFHKSWDENVSFFMQMCNDETNSQHYFPQQLNVYVVIIDGTGNIIYWSEISPYLFDVPGSVVWKFDFVKKSMIFGMGTGNEGNAKMDLQFFILEPKSPNLPKEINSSRLISLEEVLPHALQEIPLLVNSLPSEESICQGETVKDSEKHSDLSKQVLNVKDPIVLKIDSVRKKKIESKSRNGYICSTSDIFLDAEGYHFKVDIALNGCLNQFSWGQYVCIRLRMLNDSHNQEKTWPITRNFSVSVKDCSDKGQDENCSTVCSFDEPGSYGWLDDIFPVSRLKSKSVNEGPCYVEDDCLSLRLDLSSVSVEDSGLQLETVESDTDESSWTRKNNNFNLVRDNSLHNTAERRIFSWTYFKQIKNIKEMLDKSIHGTVTMCSEPHYFTDDQGYLFNLEVALNGVHGTNTWNKSICVRLFMLRKNELYSLDWPTERFFVVTLKDQTNQGKDVHCSGSHIFTEPKSDVWLNGFASTRKVFGKNLKFDSPYVLDDCIEFHITFSSEPLEVLSPVCDDRHVTSNERVADAENQHEIPPYTHHRVVPQEISQQRDENGGEYVDDCEEVEKGIHLFKLTDIKELLYRGKSRLQKSTSWKCDDIYFTDEGGYHFISSAQFRGVPKEGKFLKLVIKMILDEHNYCLQWPIARHCVVTVKDLSGNGKDIVQTRTCQFEEPGSNVKLNNFATLTDLFGKNLNCATRYIMEDTLDIHISCFNAKENPVNVFPREGHTHDSLQLEVRDHHAKGVQLHYEPQPAESCMTDGGIKFGFSWTSDYIEKMLKRAKLETGYVSHEDVFSDAQGYHFKVDIALNGREGHFTWGESVCVRLRMLSDAHNQELPWPVTRKYTIRIPDSSGQGQDIVHTGSRCFKGKKKFEWLYNLLPVSCIRDTNNSDRYKYLYGDCLRVNIEIVVPNLEDDTSISTSSPDFGELSQYANDSERGLRSFFLVVNHIRDLIPSEKKKHAQVWSPEGEFTDEEGYKLSVNGVWNENIGFCIRMLNTPNRHFPWPVKRSIIVKLLISGREVNSYSRKKTFEFEKPGSLARIYGNIPIEQLLEEAENDTVDCVIEVKCA